MELLHSKRMNAHTFDEKLAAATLHMLIVLFVYQFIVSSKLNGMGFNNTLRNAFK